MTEDKDDTSSIKVTDRRHFAPDGSPVIPDPDTGGPTETASTSGAAPGGERGFKRVSAEPSTGRAVPGVDFATLVLSFRTSAFVHLGLIEDPSSGTSEVNLEGARQMIDILSLLQEKTAGNLEKEEADLLTQVLYELRLRFVERTSSTSDR